MNNNDEKEYTINYQLYLLDKSFKTGSNLTEAVKQTRAFYEGRQFDEDGNEDNAIRVSMNFMKMCAKMKSAKVVGTERYVNFTADNDYDCHVLQRFDEYNIRKLNEKTKAFLSVLNAFVDATAVYGYRWDEDNTSYKGIYKGGLVGENYNILGWAVANNFLHSMQGQKWVMYWKEADVQGVRELVEREDEDEKERVQEFIKPDNYTEEDTGVKKEYVNHGLCTLFTRFFRIEGEVCFMCSTREVDLFEFPHFMNPNVNKAIKAKAKQIIEDYKKRGKDGQTDDDEENYDKVPDYRIDVEDLAVQIGKHKVFTEDAYKEVKEKFYLYPFTFFTPDETPDSFYGFCDLRDMVRIQKGYNFAISMVLKCLENNAYNKIIVKEGALQGQEITNEPGQVLVDHTRMANGFGIKFAESQPMPNGVIEFAQRLFEQTRLMYGFNDVMNGDVSNQDISGYAVQQMIKQANTSIEQQQQLFWQFEKEKAEIRLMFYKFYVDEAKYTYELPNYKVDQEEESRQALLARKQQLEAQGKELSIGKDIDLTKPTKKWQVRDFSGKDMFGTNFDVNVDVIQGLADSKLAEAQMWDTLIMNGNIQNMEPEMLELYLEANPTVSQRSKATLKAIVEKQKQSENYQLKEKLQQALQYLQQVLQYSKELEAQNGYKSNYIDNLTKEFTEKIGVANKVITAQNQVLQKRDAVEEGEGKSNNARGIKGTSINPEIQ